MNEIWIILKEVNDYRQHGKYFVAAFSDKPTALQIKDTLQCSIEYAEWLLETEGGRKDIEDDWYYLEKFQSGQLSDWG